MCLNYAIRYNRICVIDTTYDVEFGDDIHNYFDLSHSNIYPPPIKSFYDMARESTFTYYPSFYRGNNLSIRTVYVRNVGFTHHDVSTSLDFSSDYDERVIVHNNCGGSKLPVDFFNMFSLKPVIIDELRRRYTLLSKPYLALHIRHTDYKSNVDEFLGAVAEDISAYSTVFLATDNIDVLEKCNAAYGEKIVSFSSVSGTENKNMHGKANIKVYPAFVQDLFCDFLLLVLADKYHYSQQQSNYSKNADRLRRTPFRDRLFADVNNATFEHVDASTKYKTYFVYHHPA